MATRFLLQNSDIPESNRFRCEVRETADDAVVAPVGELDLATVTEVEEALKEQASSKRRVTLDLRGLSFMDSTGVRLVFEADAAAQRDGLAFAVVCGNEDVMRPLEISGVLKRLVIADAPEDQSV
jgi:anti-sigma B factor antagonist